ncbi:hypothetical protein [Pseudomonas sp. GD03944]|uniref:hypothetical protein n=1 Tax=Pseudomonas sp. GD03944 TaxID=2975409 RepID=UPI00244C478F|nr:hypothetical protein [Pseudomonas sp. GD03944]MDH1261850.1 hypothetical protein [Pseudomonas sp. GD03944]
MYYAREAERDHLYTRSICSILLMIPLLVIIFLSKDHGIRYGLVTASPVPVTGVVTEVELPEGMDTQKHVFYTYTTADGDTQEGSYRYPKRLEESVFEVGQPLEITYSGWSAIQSYPSDQIENQDVNFYLLVGCFIGLLILALTFARGVAAIFTHKEEDRRY